MHFFKNFISSIIQKYGSRGHEEHAMHGIKTIQLFYGITLEKILGFYSCQH